jgi:hypothetical protein
LTPERARAWIAVLRDALVVVALAYTVGHGIATGDLSLEGLVEAGKAAIGGG